MSQESAQQEYFGFICGGQRFAVPAAVVRQAVSHGEATPLPFVPEFVEGLVSVGDRVLPQVNLAAVLFPEKAHADGLSEVLLLEARRAPLCIRVDAILGRMQVESEAVSEISADADGEGASGLCLAEFIDEGQSILVIDVEQVAALVAPRPLPEGREGMLGGREADAHEEEAEDTALHLLGRIGTERYVLPLDQVLEVIDQLGCAAVPGAPAEVAGLALVRGELLLVLDLATLLGIGRDESVAGQLVVVACDDVRYGLRVDAVEDIVAIDRSSVRGIDEVDALIAGVAVHEDRVFATLEPERLLPEQRRRVYRRFAPSSGRTEKQQEVISHLLLHVRIQDDHYALPLDQVQRVAEYSAPEQLVDDGESDVVGVASIGGEILPAVDIASRLGIAGDERSTAWIVLRGEQGDVAVAVDEAQEIVSVPEDRIDRSSATRGGIVAAIVRLEDRIVSLLDTARIAAGSGRAAHGGRP